MTPRWKRDFPVAGQEESYVSRREFTRFLGLASLTFLAGTCAAAIRKLVDRFRGGQDPSVVVAEVGDIAVGGYKLFRYPAESDPCILIRLDADRFVAFDQRCTHLSCPVYFDKAGGQLVCPCHEGFFGAEDGRALAGPPKRPLRQLAVSTRRAQVWVGPMKEKDA
jgi:Rieske Fe-S protein